MKKVFDLRSGLVFMMAFLTIMLNALNATATITVFADDFEGTQAWTVNPSGTDTATAGEWEQGNPEGTSSEGTTLQLDAAASGSNCLVTGKSAGSSAGTYDIDGGATSIQSPSITLLAGGKYNLNISYYLAHLNNSTNDDYLMISIVTDTQTPVVVLQGTASNIGGEWITTDINLDAFAGQNIKILVEAADIGSGSLVEAAIDNVVITGTGPTPTPYFNNIAVLKPVQASSSYASTYNAQNAVDGKESTIWASKAGTDPEWIFIDLITKSNIHGIGLKWYDKYYPTNYCVYLSNDKTNWTQAACIDKTQPGDDIFTDNIDISTRYIGILCNSKNDVAVALKELEVYRITYPSTPTPTATPTATSTPTPTAGDKTFICTAVNDNLNPYDYTLMINGLKSLGYESKGEIRDVSVSQMRNSITSNVTYLYHTGHGFDGIAALSDGSYRYNMETITVENLTWATCLTLVPTQWKDYMGDNCQTVSGYTKNSFDGPDNDVVNSMIDEFRGGATYPIAWYNSNRTISSLSDRWCMYARTTSGYVTEYSARSGNIPTKASYTTYHGIEIAEEVLTKTVKAAARKITVTDNDALKVTGSITDFESLPKTRSLTTTDAQKIVEESIALPDDAVFDNVVTIERDNVPILYEVRYERVIDGLSVKGNGLADCIIITLDTNGEILSHTKFWPTYTISDDTSSSFVPVANILDKALAHIQAAYKGTDLRISNVTPCYATSGVKSLELTPAYAFVTDDGAEIVVDADTGMVLR